MFSMELISSKARVVGSSPTPGYLITLQNAGLFNVKDKSKNANGEIKISSP